MEFFNKKEEVIELILTQKGKELFSQGKFNPTYYSFYDSDIIYDNDDNSEQNSILNRINDTPRLKAPTGIEQTDSIINQQTINKNKIYKLNCELGGKTMGDQYAPSWNIKFVKAPLFQYYGLDREHITDGKKYQLYIKSNLDSDNSYQELIPQFNINTIYQYTKVELEFDKDYIIKDPDILAEIQEFNAFDPSEFSEYEVEFFTVDADNKIYQSLDNEELKKYVSVYFDKLAELQSGVNLKNTYDPQVEVDESTC